MSGNKFDIEAGNIGQVGDNARAENIVQGAPGEGSGPTARSARATNSPAAKNNPWAAGSFYLVAAVVVLAAFGALSRVIPWYTLPFVLLGGVLILTIVVASQLRNDERLRDKSFVTLMVESFKYLPLVKNLFPKGPAGAKNE